MELLLLSQFNLDSPLPTFFEIYAKERLVSTLADAFRFTHASIADRSARAAALLPYNSEFFFALWAVMERGFLTHLDATFAEIFFGLKRAKVRSQHAPSHGDGAGLQRAAAMLAPAAGANFPAAQHPAMEGGAPALDAGVSTPARGGGGSGGSAGSGESAVAGSGGGSRNHSASSTSSTQQQQSPPGAFDVDKVGFSAIGGRDRLVALLSVTLLPYLRLRAREWYSWLTDTSPDGIAAREAVERAQPWRKRAHRIFVAVYPLAHLTNEATRLVFYLLFIFKKTPHSDLLQSLTGVALRRMNRADYMAMGAPGKRNLILAAQMVLMAVVLGFRFLEWWTHAGGSQTAIASTSEAPLKPPPPPAPPEAATLEPGTCPVCRRSVVNPAVNTVSGAVGCYPCLREFVGEHGRCPLTRQHCNERSLRRLYEM